MNNRIAKNVLIVMSSIIVSRITGFLKVILIPHMMGVNSLSDAYNIAFMVPDLFYNLLVGGAISAAMIPMLTGYIEKKEDKEGWKIVGTFINISLILIIIASIVGIMFAPQLIKIFASGYINSDGANFDLTVKLTRILFPSIIFLTLAAISNGILNSYHRFAVASYGPAIYNVFSSISIYMFGGKVPQAVEKVAYAVLVSSILYFLFQVSFTLRNLRLYRPKFFLKHPGIKKFYKLAIPALIAAAIAQGNFIISNRFITFFPQGNVTAFTMAKTILQFPDGIFIIGMGIAILPSLSAKFSIRKYDEFKDIVIKGLKSVLLLIIPTMIGFIILRYSLISAVFKWSNEFAYIQNAGNILMFFSFSLFSQTFVGIFTNGFYAAKNTTIPLYLGSISLIANYLLGYMFMRMSNDVGLMALAYSGASLLNAVMMVAMFNLKVVSIKYKDMIIFIFKVALASLIMGLVLMVLEGRVHPDSKVLQLMYVGAEIIIASLIYFVSAILFNVKEAVKLKDDIFLKLKGLKE